MVQVALAAAGLVGLWLACTTPVPAFSTESGPLSVESQVSWATPAMPEVQILLRNSGGQPVDFVSELAAAPAGHQLDCQDDGNAAQPSLTTRFLRWDGVSRGISRGTVPAHGWAHRSVALGSVGVLPPCRIPFRVRLTTQSRAKSDPIEGLITVAAAPPIVEERGKGSALSWTAMVEKDSTYRDRVVARLLVENGEHSPVRVLVTDRRIECMSQADASWALHKGALQGQDVGPLEIGARSWGVFVSAIDLRGSKQASDCQLLVELSVDGSKGPKPVAKAEVPLTITGYVAGIGDE